MFSDQHQNNIPFEILFNHATVGIVVTDESGAIRLSNPHLERQFGYSKDELEGQRIEALIPRKYSSVHVRHREKFMDHPSSRPMGIGLDLYGQKKDGTVFPVEVSLGYYQNNDRKYTIAFVSDITERKKKDEEIQQMNLELEKKVAARTEELAYTISQLDQSKEEALRALGKERELNELKSRFVTTASHEFKTPLTTILSSASLIGKYIPGHENEEKIDKHVQRIRHAVNNMNQILNDFLSLGKLEEGAVLNKPVKIDLKALIQEVHDDLRDSLKDGQHILCSHEGNSIIHLDVNLLRNILLNLLSNAVKYSPAGKDILLQIKCRDDSIMITVKDEGIGIPKEEQPHLFNRFFRAKNAGNTEGTGLGLNIVKKYIELMDGKITFSSEINKGTVFTVYLHAQNPAHE
jgi:PAS domain S-box-containing protein